MDLGKTSFLEEIGNPAQLDLCRPQEKELGAGSGLYDGKMFNGGLNANTTTSVKVWDFLLAPPTEADNTSKDPTKMVCHCLPTATSCLVITGQSRSGNDH